MNTYDCNLYNSRELFLELPKCRSYHQKCMHFRTLSTVNRIKEQYKVSVRIPQDSERSSLVRIEGDPKGVQLARRELIEMVQRMVGMW